MYNTKMHPTQETYAELQAAYDWFNKTLFDGTLPQCLIVLIKKGNATKGYFHAEQFENVDNKFADEIAMNPDYIATQTIEQTLSTLVHEMTHLWQHHFGKPGRNRYHNKEWGSKMKFIGLQPSHTGKIGGKETGDQMTHYVLEGGLFASQCEALLGTDFSLSWRRRFPHVSSTSKHAIHHHLHGTSRSNRRKFMCRLCKTSAWGRPSLKLMCGVCKETMA